MSGRDLRAPLPSSRGHAILERPQSISASAPIDYDQVNAIKNAIAKGDYPIDADRIADALMDVYRDMKS